MDDAYAVHGLTHPVLYEWATEVVDVVAERIGDEHRLGAGLLPLAVAETQAG
jgi:hypothetical protein